MANKEKVEVKGGGDFDGAVLQNAATERTLKDLYELFKNKKDSKGADKVLELHEKTVKKNIKAVDESTDSYKQATKELNEMKKKTEEFKEKMSEIVGIGLGATFSLLAVSGKALLGFLNTGFEAFKETSQVGAGFNNDLIQLRRAAAEAAIPLDDFVKLIKTNSQTLAGLGGTVTDGARAFGLMSKEFRNSDIGEKLQAMGYSAGQLNQILADQIDIDMRTGRLRGKDSATLRKETEMLTMDFDKLAKATGLSREELQKGLKQSMKDGRILTMQSRLAGDALNNFKVSMGLMNSNFDPGMMNSLTAMMSGVIEPGDEFAKFLLQAVPGIKSFEEAVGQGKLSMADQIKGYKQQSKAITAYLSQFNKETIQKNEGLQKLAQYNASIQNLIDANTDEALKQQGAMSQITKAFGTFANFVNTLFGDLMVAVVDSPVFKDLEKTLDDLAKVFNENKGKIINVLKPMIEGFLGVINNVLKSFTAFLKDGQITPDGVKNYFIDVFTKIKDGITSALSAVFSGFAETPEQKAKRAAYEQATPEEKKRMEAADPSLKQTGVFEGMKKGMESLISLVPSLGQIAAFFGVTAVGSLAAGAGIGAGMALVAAGMTRLAIPALALGAAIGVGAGGLSLAFEGLAHIIKEVTEIFPKMTSFFDSMLKADPDKLATIGKSVASLSAGMATLAASGVVGLVGSGGLESISIALTKISDLNTKKIAETGPALESLHKGLASLNDQSFWGALSGSLTEFASSKGISSLAESIKPLENVDMVKVSAFADGIDRISKISFTNFENVTKNNVIGSFMGSITKITDMDFGKIEDTVTKSLAAVVNGIAKVGDVTQDKVAEVLKNNSLASVVNMFSKLNDISFANIEKLTTNNALASVADSFTKIGKVNVGSVENTVSGIGKLGVTFNDTLTNNSKGVEDYIKSIDKLTDSLTKLEQKMKDMPALKTEAGQVGAPTSKVYATGDISGISAEDLQKQLNTKIDDLITHIVEMKQNTKDIADASSGRRSAL